MASRYSVPSASTIVEPSTASDDHLLGLQQLVLDDRVQDIVEILPYDSFAESRVGGIRGDIVASSGLSRCCSS